MSLVRLLRKYCLVGAPPVSDLQDEPDADSQGETEAAL